MRPRSRIFPRIDPRLVPPLLAGLMLLLVGVLISLWAALSRPQVYRLESLLGQESAHPEIERVGLAEAKTAYDGDQAVFIDVRDPLSYKAGHIPGALNIPLDKIKSYAQDLDPQAWIITYCT